MPQHVWNRECFGLSDRRADERFVQAVVSRVKGTQCIEFLGVERRESSLASQQAGHKRGEAAERPHVALLGGLKVESLLSPLLMARFVTGLQGVQVGWFNRSLLRGRSRLRVMSWLALVAATEAQISTVKSKELNFLQCFTRLKRIESNFHAIAAQLGIDGKGLFEDRDIGEVAIDGPLLAAMEQRDDTLQPHSALQASGRVVAIVGRLLGLAVNGNVIFLRQPSLQRTVDVSQ